MFNNIREKRFRESCAHSLLITCMYSRATNPCSMIFVHRVDKYLIIYKNVYELDMYVL